jgi:alpha-beta hydrolase superfamily lysophospholipase
MLELLGLAVDRLYRVVCRSCAQTMADGQCVMAVPETRWAPTVDGVSIAYQDFGEGSVTLVVIHGWISHMEVYWEQPRFARFMRRLSRDLRVLHFDKRGVGMF